MIFRGAVRLLRHVLVCRRLLFALCAADVDHARRGRVEREASWMRRRSCVLWAGGCGQRQHNNGQLSRSPHIVIVFLRCFYI